MSRLPNGKFRPGKSGNPATQWGPDNPPPRSPGRPRKNAWLNELEDKLDEDPQLRVRLARRLLDIAESGKDGDALKALEIIENRAGSGPLQNRVEFVKILVEADSHPPEFE